MDHNSNFSANRVWHYGAAFLLSPLALAGAYGFLTLFVPSGYGFQITWWVLLVVSVLGYVVEIFIVVPVFLSLWFLGRLQKPAVPIGALSGALPVAGLTGALLLAQVIPVPALWFGPSIVGSSTAGQLFTTLLVFGSVGVTRWALCPHSDSALRASQRAIVVGGVFVMWALAGAYRPELTVMWSPSPRIQQHLLSETPLGTSIETVQTWVQGLGKHGNVNWRRDGSAVIHTSVFDYAVILPTYVSVDYMFDAQARLIDIRVTKETDGF